MELRQIRFFVAVAEDRHYGRAAERMYIAQPALSQHIRRLERNLEVRLFDRSGRHVRLTPAGEVFLEGARRILAQADEAALRARLAETGEAGTVAIGVELAAAGRLLPRVLRAWSAHRPEVRPTLTAGRRLELLDLLRRHELDVAVLDGPVVDLLLATEVVIECAPVVLLPETHSLLSEPRVALARLDQEAFVLLDRAAAPALHDRTLAMCDEVGFNPRVALEVRDPGLLTLAVASGVGVAVVGSNYVAEPIEGVVRRQLTERSTLTSVVAVRSRNDASEQAVEFVDLLCDVTRDARYRSARTLSSVGGPGPLGARAVVIDSRLA